MTTKPDLTKSQLFLDDTWIGDQRMLTRLWHKGDIYPEPVLEPQMPWEGQTLVMYGTVMRLGDTWRMYYSSGLHAYFCIVESDDGFNWHRPTVGRVEFNGSKENNIVHTPVNCATVCYDPQDEDAPFKMITLMKGSGIRGGVSKDGLSWTMLDEPLIVKPPCSDVQALWFGKVDGKYIITHKTMHGHARRSVCIAESEDFRNWSPSRLILTSDLYDPPDTEYHGMVGFPYADMYLGLAERWINTPNHIELLLVWSHDRKTWHRPIPREPFIGPTYYWNQGWNTSNSAGPLQVGNQLRFYFNGQSGSHFHVKPSGPRKLGVIGLATITVDRFASITAGFMEGQLVTKPMTWPGGDLLINASTTRHIDGYPLDGGGQMSIEVWDEQGHPIDGYCGDTKAEYADNAPVRGVVNLPAIKWAGNRSLNDLAGQRIRLVFTMRDSHLYGFRSSG